MKNREIILRFSQERELTDLKFALKDTALRLQAKENEAQFLKIDNKLFEISRAVYIATGAILLFGFTLGLVLKFVKF